MREMLEDIGDFFVNIWLKTLENLGGLWPKLVSTKRKAMVKIYGFESACPLGHDDCPYDAARQFVEDPEGYRMIHGKKHLDECLDDCLEHVMTYHGRCIGYDEWKEKGE